MRSNIVYPRFAGPLPASVTPLAEPTTTTIPIGSTLTDFLVEIPGDFLALLSAPAGFAISVKFNTILRPAITMRTGDRIYTRFARIYITTTTSVSGGSATFFFGGDSATEFWPGPATAASLLTPAATAYQAEILALLASWTSLFNFSNAIGQQGIIIIYNNGPNYVEISTSSSIAFGLGERIAAGALAVIDNPGGQQWFVRAATANQIAGAATNVHGFWTGS